MDENLNIQQFIIGPFQSNCYIITDSDTNECIIIDPGEPIKEIPNFISLHKLKPKYILLTHCHLDHIGGADFLREKYNIKLCVSKDDSKMLSDTYLNLSEENYMEIKIKPADIILNGGDELKFGNKIVSVISTPGHTAGGLCFLVGNVCFTGDTIFKDSIGRTDLPTSDYESLISSIKNHLFTLNDSVILFPGHGGKTTIGYEKSNNPFFK